MKKSNFLNYIAYCFLLTNILFSQSLFAISSPKLTYPNNNSTTYSFNQRLDIQSVVGAEVYQIQYDTTTNFNSINLVTTDTFSSLSYTTTYLRKGRKYYWRAKAINIIQGDTSAWSSYYSFSIATNLRSNYLPILPQDGSTGDLTNLKLEYWQVAKDYPIIYLFELDTIATFKSPLRVLKTTNQKTYYDSNLFDYSRKIFWRGTVVSPLGDTINWSKTFTYTFYDAPTINTVRSPTSIVYFIWSGNNIENVFFQLDTSEKFDSPLLYEKLSPSNIKRDTITNLLYGQKYYYRIRAEKNGKTSKWKTQSFDVMSSPQNILPRKNTIISDKDINVTFSWASDSFTQVIVASESSFTDIILDTVLVNSVELRGVKSFKFDKIYYWKVRYLHSKDTSEWAFESFNSNRGRITQIEPENNSTNLDVLITFRGSRITGVSDYILEIDTGKVFNNELSTFAITETQFQVSGTLIVASALVKYKTNYVWRIRPIYLSDTSNNYYTRTFKTKSAPTLYYPGNGSEGMGTRTNLLIDQLKGTSVVEWQLDTLPTFQSPYLLSGIAPHVPDDSKVRLFLPHDLLYETKYYWKARCISDIDTSEWSTVFNFTTTDTPWLESPKNNAVNVSLNPLLEWGIQGSNSGHIFQYQLATDSLFSPKDIITLPKNSFMEKTVSCNYSTKYYWRVRAFNTIDTSSWSSIFSFTTIAPPIPPAPSLIDPANGKRNLPAGAIGFYWREVANAHSYELQISNDENFSDPFISTPTISWVIISGFTSNYKYYWRVRANVDTFVSPWSNVRWFETNQSTSVVEIDFNDNFVVYPVPASSEISIKADLPCTLEITSVNGKIVYKDSNSEAQKTIDVSQLLNGVYFIKASTTDGQIFYKKIIIQH